MRGARRRLEKSFSMLSAAERANFALKALHEHVDEDPLVRSTMPKYQSDEFNRLIRVMNAANGNLLPFLVPLLIETRALSERLGWVACIRQFQVVAEITRMHLDGIELPAREAGLGATSDSEERPLQLLEDALASFDRPSTERLVSGLLSGVKHVLVSIEALSRLIDRASMDFDGEDLCGAETKRLIRRIHEEIESVWQSLPQVLDNCERPSEEDVEKMSRRLEKLMPDLQGGPESKASALEKLLASLDDPKP